MSGDVQLTIDDRVVTARPNEKLLDCAHRHGISIPHLCTHPDLPAFGACRMCLVQIDGMRGFPASCSTEVQQGMVVHTQTEELRELRRGILELSMLEHPSACLICNHKELCEKYRPAADKAGCTTGCHTCNNKEVCDVRSLSGELHLTELPFAPFYRGKPVDRSNPFIDIDLNLCILCGRCVRICEAQHGWATLAFLGRGSETVIGPAFDRSLSAAGCRFCGSCIDVCPTGTLADRFAKWHGAPDAVTETTCQLCDAACAVKVLTDCERAVEVRAINSALPICVLGRFAMPYCQNGPDRLRVPRMRVGEILREIPWDDALASAAEKLEPYRGGAFALVCDAGTTLEDRYLFEKFTRDVMGSEHYIELGRSTNGDGRPRGKLPSGVKAVLVAGDLLDSAQLDGVELLIAQDCYPTALTERADFEFPIAILSEVAGTVRDDTGVLRALRKSAQPPEEAKPEWQLIAELARAMGSDGFAHDSIATIAAEAGLAGADLRVERDAAPVAALDPRVRVTYFRGHLLEDRVGQLDSVPSGAGE
jgi:predicted molibdopterin-dependent oxidoreductase YjgC